MFLICLLGVSELNYISQIVIMMYEDPTKVSIGSPHYFIFSICYLLPQNHHLCIGYHGSFRRQKL